MRCRDRLDPALADAGPFLEAGRSHRSMTLGHVGAIAFLQSSSDIAAVSEELSRFRMMSLYVWRHPFDACAVAFGSYLISIWRAAFGPFGLRFCLAQGVAQEQAEARRLH